MSRPPAKPRRTEGPSALATPAVRGILVAAALAILAAAISGAAVYRFDAIVRSLPSHRLARVEWSQLQAARQRYHGDALEAMVLVANSEEISAVHRAQTSPADAAAAVRDRLPLIRRSMWGYLQLATLACVQLERQGVPPLPRWERVRGALPPPPIERCVHHLAALGAAEFETFLAQTGSPQTARAAAAMLQSSHGPFVQMLARQIETMAAALDDSGQHAEAARARVTLHRALRGCLVENAAPSVRLLAADLLARSLSQPAYAGDAAAQKLRAACEAWRRAYRADLRSRWIAPAPMRPDDAPWASEPADRAVAERLLLAFALLGAVAALALAGVGSIGVAVLVRKPSGDSVGSRAPGWGALLSGLVVAGVWFAAWFVVRPLMPELLAHDAIAMSVGRVGWPRAPLLGAGFAAAGLLLAAVGMVWARPRSVGGAAGVARMGLWAWIMTSAALLAVLMTTAIESADRTAPWWTREAPPGFEQSGLADAIRGWSPGEPR